MTKLSHTEKKRESEPSLKVDSFSELVKHEKEILARIERTPNGAQLFLIHPFMLFKDIGVELSERAGQELRHYEPELIASSAVAYRAVKNAKEKQHVRYHLQGLFERREKS